MKNTMRNTKKSLEHMSLLLENSHAMHFQTMPMCIIQTQKIEQTLARLCKKYIVAVSQTEIQATFTFITDLQQQTQNSAQTKHINIFIYAFAHAHTHTHYTHFLLNLLNISNVRLKTVIPAALVSLAHPSFFSTSIAFL